MAKGPRSFDEIIAVLNPAERARIERIETFSDPNAPVGEAEVSLAEDRDQPGEWCIEYFHEADGYVTIFAGPMAQQRASLLRRAQIRGSEDHPGGRPQQWLSPARLAIPRRHCYFWRYEITEEKAHCRQDP
jgi:hypothetical protein